MRIVVMPMKNIALCTSLLLCLGSMPLWAPSQEDQTQESPKLVAAAANPGALQTETPTVAKAAPRKVVQRPEPFVLDKQSLKTLQSTAPGRAKDREMLVEHAAHTVDLKISSYAMPPNDTTRLMMAPFVNVRSLEMVVEADDLPILPCPEKLESLSVHRSYFKTVSNIKHYPNLCTLVLDTFYIRQDVDSCVHDKAAYLAMCGQLAHLRCFHCTESLALDGSCPAHTDLFARFVQNNPLINDLGLAGCLSEEVVGMLRALPLRALSLRDGQIDQKIMPLLCLETLEELRLRDMKDINLTSLWNAPLRVLSLEGNKISWDMTEVIRSMIKLEELDLRFCNLEDPVVSELLKMAPQLKTLNLKSNEKISVKMRQKLRDAFGDRVLLSRSNFM